MSDLISRQAAVNAALIITDGYFGDRFGKDFHNKLKKKLEDLPSAERRHGHWDIEISHDGYQATYHCSECGHQFKWIYDPHFPPVFNFCQKCGADMREKS